VSAGTASFSSSASFGPARAAGSSRARVGAFLLLRFTAIRARWRILTTSLLALLFAPPLRTILEGMKTLLQPKEDYNMTDDAAE